MIGKVLGTVLNLSFLEISTFLTDIAYAVGSFSITSVLSEDLSAAVYCSWINSGPTFG